MQMDSDSAEIDSQQKQAWKLVALKTYSKSYAAMSAWSKSNVLSVVKSKESISKGAQFNVVHPQFSAGKASSFWLPRRFHEAAWA